MRESFPIFGLGARSRRTRLVTRTLGNTPGDTHTGAVEVAHACNPTTEEARAGGFQACLRYLRRSRFGGVVTVVGRLLCIVLFRL